jgi:hypothetical protein
MVETNEVVSSNRENLEKSIKIALQESQVIMDNKNELRALEEYKRNQDVKLNANTRMVLATATYLPHYKNDANAMAQITGVNDEYLTLTVFSQRYGYKRSEVKNLVECGELATYNGKYVRTDEAIEAMSKSKGTKLVKMNIVKLATTK